MVSLVVSSAVDRGFEARSGQTKDYKIGICCFSTNHAALVGVERHVYPLAQNQDNVSEWSDMSTRWLRIRIMCQSGATCLPVGSESG